MMPTVHADDRNICAERGLESSRIVVSTSTKPLLWHLTC
jgi:hypothetical protein